MVRGSRAFSLGLKQAKLLLHELFNRALPILGFRFHGLSDDLGVQGSDVDSARDAASHRLEGSRGLV